MAPLPKPSAQVLKMLGLSGGMATAVSCGPCLDVAACLEVVEDTGDTGDTGEEEDDTGSSEDAPASAASPTERVLERGVLPSDVAALLRAKRDEGPGT